MGVDRDDEADEFDDAGNYKLEQTIAADVVPWSYFGVPDDVCQNCTVNAFAAKG